MRWTAATSFFFILVISFISTYLTFSKTMGMHVDRQSAAAAPQPALEADSWKREEGLFEEIAPKPSHIHTHTVIFLHGRGDNAADFSKGIARNTWADSQARSPVDVFPSFRWVFPTAGWKPCARGQQQQQQQQQGTGYPRSMSQWFDIWDHLHLRENEMLQQPGLRESVVRVRGIIADEAARLGGRYDRIVLMGISQGGATGVHTLLNLTLPGGGAQVGGGERRLGAFVGVSCRMPFPDRTLAETRRVLGLDGGVPEGDEVVRNTPVMLQHCMDDPTVLFESGKQLRDTLLGLGASVAWREYPEGGHWFKSPQGLEDLTRFLSEVLPET